MRWTSVQVKYRIRIANAFQKDAGMKADVTLCRLSASSG